MSNCRSILSLSTKTPRRLWCISYCASSLVSYLRCVISPKKSLLLRRFSDEATFSQSTSCWSNTETKHHSLSPVNHLPNHTRSKDSISVFPPWKESLEWGGNGGDRQGERRRAKWLLQSG